LVIADPNPGDGIALKDTDGAMASRDAHGPKARVIEQALKPQAGWLGSATK
jgi:hypothetical protein